MIDFAELRLTGSQAELQAFLAHLSEPATRPTEAWARDPQRENELRDRVGTVEHIVFRTPEKRGIEKASLMLFLEEGGTSARVANIVPLDLMDLTKAQYNAILDAFYEDNVRGRADHFGLLVERESGEFKAEDLVKAGRMTADALTKLRLFSSAANKSTGSSHPLDQRRWWDFIIASVEGGGEGLELETLRSLLTEEQGWDEDRALKLSEEYDELSRFARYWRRV